MDATLLLLAFLSGVSGDRPDPAVSTASVCAFCHTNAPRASAMRDAQGRGVAPHDLWRSTMMASSARDPFWRAQVSAETAATPSRRTDIEAKCLTCHTPLAHRSGAILWMSDLDADTPLGELARDGVSCTICHGITPDGLGTDESFTAGFVLDDHRRLFGPHEKPFAMPMRHRSGFTPALGAHLLEASLCGTCHTLETNALAPDGKAVGMRLLEQGPYLEWRNSVFCNEGGAGRGVSCQDCHVPKTSEDGEAIRTRIARNPGGRDFPPTRPRDPFGRHLFVGGNTLVPSLLAEYPEELHVRAPASALRATLDATRDQLRRAATVTIEHLAWRNGRLTFEVVVENLTGHKLPTGHPSRRAWLRVVVRDRNGVIRFASGTTDSAGRILDADGAPLPAELAGGPVMAHHDVVSASDQVATFEAVMADASGEPTHTLMRGASWLQDDRILPAGWSSEHPEAARTASVGVAPDSDFTAGSDRVRYVVDLPPEEVGAIEIDLLYQPASARWLAELFRWKTPEIEAFRRMIERADRTPIVLATARN